MPSALNAMVKNHGPKPQIAFGGKRVISPIGPIDLEQTYGTRVQRDLMQIETVCWLGEGFGHCSSEFHLIGPQFDASDPIRVFSVKRLKGDHPSIASNSSMKPEIIDKPLSQNLGSLASNPNGAKSSLWCLDPPARSISKYLSSNPSDPLS